MSYPTTKDYDGKTWITGHASGAGTSGVDDSIEFDPSDYDDELIGNPEKITRGLYIEDGEIKEGDTGTVIPPSPDQAIKELKAYFESTESTPADARAMRRALLNKYPDFEVAVQNGNFEEAKLILGDALDAGDITQTQHDDMVDVLDGVESYM